jgi:hypothetical protein
MDLADFLLAGLAGGILMGLVAEIGYLCRWFQMSLFIVDGEFALKILRAKSHRALVYALGIPIHLVTGTVFGLGYGLLCHYLPIDPRDILVVAIYTFFLWIGMLCCALPIAGQGWMGQKAGNRVWFEQLLVHLAFGIGLWWVL